jgi:cytochrome P450
VTIPRGGVVVAVLGSATTTNPSFDPRSWTSPRPNRHLAFGLGAHLPGAPLARLEGEIAVTTLPAGFPISAWKRRPVTSLAQGDQRGPEQLPVALESGCLKGLEADEAQDERQ